MDGGRAPQHQPSFGAVCGPPFLPCPVVWSSNANAALLVRVPSKMTAARSVVFVKVRFGSTRTEEDVPATRVADRHLSIYWRMLRPEFVKGDAETMTYRVRKYKQVREKLKRSRRVVYICTVLRICCCVDSQLSFAWEEGAHKRTEPRSLKKYAFIEGANYVPVRWIGFSGFSLVGASWPPHGLVRFSARRRLFYLLL